MSNQLTQEEKVRYAKEARARHKRWVEEHHLTEANYQAWIRENFPKPEKKPESDLTWPWQIVQVLIIAVCLWPGIAYIISDSFPDWLHTVTFGLLS